MSKEIMSVVTHFEICGDGVNWERGCTLHGLGEELGENWVSVKGYQERIVQRQYWFLCASATKSINMGIDQILQTTYRIHTSV
jgi:hypothetical protein